ncbi:hypothetical protein P3S68_027282 [Capsicum galapagoense]
MQGRIFFDNDIDLSALASTTQGFTRVDLEGLLHWLVMFKDACSRKRIFKLRRLTSKLPLKEFGEESLKKSFE